jgi:hypothetical protein
MLFDALAPENLVLPVADYDSDIGAISVTVDHVSHPAYALIESDSSIKRVELKAAKLKQQALSIVRIHK